MDDMFSRDGYDYNENQGTDELLIDDDTFVFRDRNATDAPPDTQNIFWGSRFRNDSLMEPTKYTLVLGGILSIFGIVTNGIVLVALLCLQDMRKSNSGIMIGSLALSDFLVCFVIMSTSLFLRKDVLKSLVGDKSTYCHLWTAVAVFFCAASSFNVSAIAVDRYIYIVDGIHYDRRMKRSRLCLYLCLVWLASAVISFTPSVLSWAGVPHFSKKKDCDLLPSREYSAVLVILVIIVPCILLTVLYSRMFYWALIQLRALRRYCYLNYGLNKGLKDGLDHFVKYREISIHEVSREESTSSDVYRNQMYDGQRESITYTGSCVDYEPPPPATSQSALEKFTTPDSWLFKSEPTPPYSMLKYCSQTGSISQPNIHSDAIPLPKKFTVTDPIITDMRMPNGSCSSSSDISVATYRSFKSALAYIRTKVLVADDQTLREVKAATVMLMIVGTYVLCLLPYGIVHLVDRFSTDVVPGQVSESLLWLAYSNSCWNPVIYALMNRSFRHEVRERFRLTHKRRQDRLSLRHHFRKASAVSRGSAVSNFSTLFRVSTEL